MSSQHHQFYATTTVSSNSGHRLQPSQLDSKRMLLQRKGAESQQVTPDSTTEPPKPLHDFQEGDDVFFHNDDGQNILGTIGQVTPLRCQILFGDGTQQWALYKRIKKLSCSFDEPSPSPSQSRRSNSNNNNNNSTEESSSRTSDWADKTSKTDLTCIICKTKKKVSSKKIGIYNAKNPFKCARCYALKAVPVSAASTLRKVASNPAENSNQKNNSSMPRQVIRRPSTSSGSGKYSSKNLTISPSTIPPELSNRKGLNIVGSAPPAPSGSRLTSPTGSPPVVNGVDSHSPGMPDKPMKTSYSVHLKTSPIKSSKNNLCFNCSDRTVPYDRVHCNMCERYCHLMCLALTPPPLKGDKFWDVMCVACGTQNKNEKGPNQVFSVRRNVNTWSDVVHLIIACLKVKNMGQQYFDFETQILPFIDSNMDKLHLPRQYKAVSWDERKTKLLNALQNSRLRFKKHKDKLPSPMGGQETTYWALCSDQSKSNPTSPELISVRPYPTTSKSLTISPLNPNSVHDLSRSSSSCSKSESNSDSSGLSISPNSSLPLSLKNRTNASPGSSPALSIFPIPNPNYSSSSSSGIGSSINGSSSPNYPRVTSKEVIMKSPINTNIKLSPTTSITTTVSGQGKGSVSLTLTPKKTSEGPSTLAKDQNTKKVVEIDKLDQNATTESDKQRQRLRIRLPIKQAEKPEDAKGNEVTEGLKKKLPVPAKFPPPGTTMLARPPPLASSSGPRKRFLSSDEEDQEEEGPAQQTKKVHTQIPSSSPLPKVAASVIGGGRAIKSASVENSPAKTPPISPLRLSIPARGRPKLLRSSVLKNKMANNKAVKGIGNKGRGRGVKIVSPLRKESIPMGYTTPHTLNGEPMKSEANGKSMMESGLKIVKIRRSVAPGGVNEPEITEPEPAVDDFKVFNENLIGAVLHNDLRVTCLPGDKPEKCAVAKLFLSEAKRAAEEDEEVENFPGRGRRDRLFMDMPVNKKRRDLEDTDSYEIVARKVGPDGVFRYLVVWRQPVKEGEKDFDDEIERLFLQHEKSSGRKSGPNGIIKEERRESKVFSGTSPAASPVKNGIKEETEECKPPLNFTGLIPGGAEDKSVKPSHNTTAATVKTQSPKILLKSSSSSSTSSSKIAAAFLSATNKVSPARATSSSSSSTAASSPQKSSSNKSNSNVKLPCVIDLTDSP